MFSAHPAISQTHALITFNYNFWIFSSLTFVMSAQSEFFFFFGERKIACCSTPTYDATFPRMIGSQNIVEHKRARPFPLYSKSYYIATSDLFSFHTIQMQEVSYFKIEPRRNVTMHVQSHELHHGCSNEVVGIR